MGLYYSEQLKKYISLQPLKNEQKVIQAAKKLNIHLQWDDFGNLINICFADARRIADELGAYIMTPKDYWILYGEARQSNNQELLESLSSNFFTELLDRIYTGNEEYIDHPVINEDGTFSGEHIKETIITGRPGWIKPEDIDAKTGHPFRIRSKGNDDGLIKYWSPDVNIGEETICFAIRGYVTSVDAISLDLGIPVNAKNKKMMIRLCYDDPPAAFLSKDETDRINELLKGEFFEELNDFSGSELFGKIRMGNSPECIRIKEELYFKLGKCKIKDGGSFTHLFSYGELVSFAKNIKQNFQDAVCSGKSIVLVCGHKNPDSDTVISSLFEAFRCDIDNDNPDIVYIPLIQSNDMPSEITEILGEDIVSCLIYEKDFDLQKLLESGLARIIYTDQNYQEELQKYVINITDHHRLSDKLSDQETSYPVNIVLAGSCTAMIVCKYAGMGLSFDRMISGILYDAMLMDTECRVMHKMTAFDEAVMNYIRNTSGTGNESERYQQLMGKLLSETDVEKLFRRDYKKFQGFGFATMKIKELSNDDHRRRIIEGARTLAENENLLNYLYFTLVKITEYCKDGTDIAKESFCFVWNKNAETKLKIAVKEQIKKSALSVFNNAVINVENDIIVITGVGKQISRKQIAPDIERVVRELTKYIRFESIDKWVSRDFLMYEEWMKELAPKAVCSRDGHICNITYYEAKAIVERMGLSMLSLPEYWKVYHEAKKNRDTDFLQSITAENFIEFLDTVSTDCRLIDHPAIENGELTGEFRDELIISAVPGLIHPNDIDERSGLPAVIHSPLENGNLLWRYWSPPETGTYVFSRSHIFLIGKPCLDAKMMPDESLVNLGIRTVKKEH